VSTSPLQKKSPRSRDVRPVVLLKRSGMSLLAAGILSAGVFQMARSAERWAVRGGDVRSEAESLFDPSSTQTRRVLWGDPQKVLLLRPSLAVETYRDSGGHEVAVVPNAAFTFDQGVVQDKTLVLFGRGSLAVAVIGLLLWAFFRRTA